MKLRWDATNKIDRSKGEYVRERSDDLYHSARWTRLSRAWRQQHPLCEECRRQGTVTPATCTDHIVPWPICQDFFDESNLQSLCDRCNMLKGERDRERIGRWRRGVGEQGGGSKSLKR